MAHWTPGILRRGEQSLRLFVSSVIEGLRNERAAIAEIAESLGLFPWVFEQTPAHSDGLERSYLEQVASSDFLVWIDGGSTTGPVEREVRAALSSQRTRVLAFRLPITEPDECTKRLRQLVGAKVKYVETSRDGLANAVRLTLQDELTRAYRSIRAPATQPYALPERGHALRGRDDLRDEILSELSGEGGAVVAISGMAGVGKSAVAIDIADRMAGDYPDGVLFVDVRGLDEEPRQPEMVVVGLLGALGMASDSIPPAPDDRLELWQSQLATRRLLLLFDDVRDEAQIRRLLPASGPSSALVTSRRLLAGIERATIRQLDVVSRNAAVEILGDALGSERVLSERTVAEHIADLCGALPLALFIAGRRLATRPSWTLAYFADQLADERRRLERLRVGDLDVRAAFNLSYRLLAPREAQTFRTLAFFRAGGFPGQAVVAALAGAADAAESLELLADVGLLQAVRDGAYRIHELLRLLAAEHLDPDGRDEERSEALKNVAAWYERAVFDAGERLAKAGIQTGESDPAGVYREAFAWIDAEAPTIEHVLSLLDAAREHRLTSALVLSMTQYFGRSRDWARWRVVLELALTAAREDHDPAAEAKVLQNLGIAAAQVGDRTEASERLHRAADLHRGLGDLVGEARALAQLGSLHKDCGQLDEALSLQRTARDLYRRAGDEDGEARALGDLANTLDITGEHEQAVCAHREALSAFRKTGDLEAEAREHANLAIGLASLDDIAGAEASMRRARDLFALLDSREETASATVQLAEYVAAQERFDEALALLDKVIDDYLALRNERGHVRALTTRGEVRFQSGDPRQAQQDFKAAAAAYEVLGDSGRRAVQLANAASVELETGDLHIAAFLAEPAFAALDADTSGSGVGIGIQLRQRLALAPLMHGQVGSTERLLLEAERVARVAEPEALASARAMLARLYTEWGERASARNWTALARQAGAVIDDPSDRAVDVRGAGPSQRRRLTRITAEVAQRLGVAPASVRIVVAASPEDVGSELYVNEERVGLDPIVVTDETAWHEARLSFLLYGAVAQHLAMRAGLRSDGLWGALLLDMVGSFTQFRCMVAADGTFDEQAVRLRPIEAGSSFADIGAHLGAALAGSSSADTALLEWVQSQSAVDPDLAEAIGELRNARLGITEPSDLIADAAELFRGMQTNEADEAPS